MKYVPGEQRLQALLQEWGLARFNPYHLSAAQTEVAVRFMQAQADAAVTVPGELDELDATPPKAKKQPVVASLPSAKTLKPSTTHAPPGGTHDGHRCERDGPERLSLGCCAGLSVISHG